MASSNRRFRIAGMNPLLAGLFEDDETENTGGLGLFPGVRIESESRGRGYGLTMKPQQKDPQKVTVQAPTMGEAQSMLGDVNITNTNTNTNTLGEVEEPKEIDPGKAFADQYLQNFSKYDVGQKNLFGGQDVDFLREKGVSDDDIRRIADERSTVQQLPAAVYQRLGGVTPAEQSTSSNKVGAQAYAANYTQGKSGFDAGAAGIFGGQDVDAMRQKGYSDNEIKATVNAVRNSGQNIPDAVFRRLGNF